ncbi:DUF6624 domain-containing protein [Streptomyces sp. NPDC004111]|uniref:DUF6624 domain-containing protein n=1 Tax=Streptomyces sp. NPDC004111 TaxID=3364690 RepID=UPI0036B065F4
MTGRPLRPDLARSLVERAESDEGFRKRWLLGQLSDQEQAHGMLQHQADAQVLDRILAEHGWPTRPLVGADGATAAWRLALHADRTPHLQYRALQALGTAASLDAELLSHWAHLYDRYRVVTGQQQVYGTQHRLEQGQLTRLPVGSPELLDSRRASVGLPPADTAQRALHQRLAQLAVPVSGTVLAGSAAA